MMIAMFSDTTFRRLRWHAGLEDMSAGDDVPSVSSCFRMEAVDTSRLESALSDFVATLEVLNHELNGKVPSEHVSSEAPLLPSTLVYAITEVIRLLRDSQAKAADENEQRTIGRAGWRAETAWSAVLAGDIDDIQEHLSREEAARFD